MARLFHSGAEINAANVPSGPTVVPDGFKFGSGSVTRDTTVFRSGLASWKFDSTGSDVTIRALITVTTAAVTYYIRVYLRAAAAPTATALVLVLDSNIGVRLRTDGALELYVVTAQGSPSSTVTDSAWHRVELKGTVTAGNWTAAELVVDGVSAATWSGSSFANTPLNPGWGWFNAPGANTILNIDDVALNDSTGAAQNSYPGAGTVVLLTPTADSAKGTGWTTDSAGTTNFFAATDNTPPAGIADTTGSTGLHQIRNATSNANSSYDATMTTYTAAGIGASDTVNAVVPWVASAAPVTTSAKAGTVGVVSNPAITNVVLGPDGTAGAFWSGVAGGTYPTGWKWSRGTVAHAPSVTLGTAPVMRVTQVTASTRIAMVCGMFIYVDYTPAAGAAAVIPDVNMALAVT